MPRTGRPGLSPAQKRELWSRWKAGETLSDISRSLGKQPGSIHGTLRVRGGIAPAERRRSVRCLRLEERESISRGIAAGISLRQIAIELGRSPSTVVLQCVDGAVEWQGNGLTAGSFLVSAAMRMFGHFLQRQEASRSLACCSRALGPRVPICG